MQSVSDFLCCSYSQAHRTRHSRPPPRPPQSNIIFRRERREWLDAEWAKGNHGDVTLKTFLCSMWSKLPEQEKRYYRSRASEEEAVYASRLKKFECLPWVVYVAVTDEEVGLTYANLVLLFRLKSSEREARRGIRQRSCWRRNELVLLSKSVLIYIPPLLLRSDRI